MENNDELAEVTRVVKAKLGFYAHLVIFILVNAALVCVNLATNPERLWFQWPLIGWGAGLALHAALALIGVKGRSMTDWMIARELKKRQRRTSNG